jgi:hypothetical protein
VALRDGEAKLTRSAALAVCEALIAAWDAASAESAVAGQLPEIACPTCGTGGPVSGSQFLFGYMTAQRVMVAAIIQVPL